MALRTHWCIVLYLFFILSLDFSNWAIDVFIYAQVTKMAAKILPNILTLFLENVA